MISCCALDVGGLFVIRHTLVFLHYGSVVDIFALGRFGDAMSVGLSSRLVFFCSVIERGTNHWYIKSQNLLLALPSFYLMSRVLSPPSVYDQLS